MGILAMAKTIFKNLVSRPFTERYPYVKKEYFVGSRGSIRIDISKCIFCGICQRKCPTAAIVVSKEPKTWEIDRLRCISCNYCVEVCPKKCLSMDVNFSAACGKREKELHQNA